MSNTQSIKAALIKQIIESGTNIPLGTLTGNIDLLIFSAELDGFTQAKEIMFPTITEPELKVKDLKAGEWYIIDTSGRNKWLFKFVGFVHPNYVKTDKCYTLRSKSYYDAGILCQDHDILTIRHATTDEIIKYFPNEFEIDTHSGNDISQLTDHPNTM
jgi:hypothetical protein